MNPDDRKRRFNEAIVNMLYPSSPQVYLFASHYFLSIPRLIVYFYRRLARTRVGTCGTLDRRVCFWRYFRYDFGQQEPCFNNRKNWKKHCWNVGALDHCDNNSSTSVEEEHDSETEKLSRAQRKKIRKKKLKEEVVRRGKLIGPLLPLTSTQVTRDTPPVRSNASEEGSKNIVTILLSTSYCVIDRVMFSLTFMQHTLV